jgi:uncharacterized protein (DUF3820 family)
MFEVIEDYKAQIYKSLKMPFGKHKGLHPNKLPVEYCKWLRKNKIDGQIGKYFKKAIGEILWSHKQQKFYCQNFIDPIVKPICVKQCYKCSCLK